MVHDYSVAADDDLTRMTEAGIVPVSLTHCIRNRTKLAKGTMFYLSLWYPRARVARRAAYILATANLGRKYPLMCPTSNIDIF